MRIILHYQLILVLILISSVIPEEITNALPQIGGNQSFAMGGTYIAFNQGINALFGNPAGLPADNTVEFILGYYWQIHKNSQFDDAYYLRYWNGSYSIEYKKKYRLNYLGMSWQKKLSHYPFKFAGAIGFSPFYYWESTRERVRSYSYSTSTPELRRSYTIEEEKMMGLYDIISIGIGFSWEGTGSIGISLNYPVRENYQDEFNLTHTYEIDEEIKGYKYTSKDWRNVYASQFIRIGGMLHLTSRFILGIIWMQRHHYNIANQRRDFPVTLNYGIAYRILPTLLLAFDMQSQPWEKVRIDDEYISNVKNGNAYRLGLEYTNKIIMRTGYAVDRLPILDSEDNAVNMMNITLGIGFSAKYVIFEIAARYRFTKFKTEEWQEVYNYNFSETVLQSSIKLTI
jgi:hypothetical protein